MEKYSFFDSTGNDIREYSAEDFANFHRTYLGNGVLDRSGQIDLGVFGNGNDMQIKVTSGNALIEGYLYQNTEDLPMIVDAAEATLDRIDRIVVRLDKTAQNRYIRAFVKRGQPASSPTPPLLQRDEFVYEISLAQIFVSKGKSFLEDSQITDERNDTSVCGWANSKTYNPNFFGLTTLEHFTTTLQSYVSLIRNTPKLISNNTATKVDGMSVVHDHQSEFNFSTQKITIKEKGIYSIFTQATWTGPKDSLINFLYVNGTLKQRIGQCFIPVTANNFSVNGTCYVELQEGDEIDFYVLQSGSGSSQSLDKFVARITKLS